MNLLFIFPSGWWLELLIIYGIYLLILLFRKGGKEKELKNQLLLGLVAFFFSLIIEFFGVNNGLWTYFPGNWPIVLWVCYFGIGLLAYQFTKIIDEITS